MAPPASNKGGSDIPQRPALLTRRGADILVRVEKMLDEAAKAVADTPPSKSSSSGSATPLTESFAAATPPAARKN